ncbi:uncharacterized protein LOC115331946 [Ixodes scapularis]|uniref:uncharacterized protein LOC115331946 n=1 Tax=Ixodes scapularis TaxID=6945 RepID=UPI001C3910F4|nr:uncharacterized protein LOC115331946 [Ixodes scapularis]
MRIAESILKAAKAPWSQKAKISKAWHPHPKIMRSSLGEEAQRLGQVLREYSKRLNPILREQAQMTDTATAEELRSMVNLAKKKLENTVPTGEGMKTAKDTMTAIILEKMNKNVFEDVEKFSTFIAAMSGDIDEIGAGIIEQGTKMCDGTVVEDGLTDFDKKYLWSCVEAFRFTNIQKKINEQAG